MCFFHPPSSPAGRLKIAIEKRRKVQYNIPWNIDMEKSKISRAMFYKTNRDMVELR